MDPDSPSTRLREITAEARHCLSWLLSGMKVEAEIESFVREGQILLSVLCGSESSIVIGRKGQTLEALQLLVNRILARKFPEVLSQHRIIIDVEGYRERRKTNLLDMARRAAEEVRDTGETVSVGPLNAFERYLIHNALKTEEGIVTVSQGEGPMKQILVSPGPDPAV